MNDHSKTYQSPSQAVKIEALLLTCMDFRLIEHKNKYMEMRGLTGDFDQIILAGASLGAINEKYTSWNETFWQHLQLAIELHNIRKVILMDHRDCGAYRIILKKDFYKNRKEETEIHSEYLNKLAKLIKEKYPHLEIEMLLMDLDGKVETF
ncbi:carbonic anhydrase [Melioribacteraceae bacterium 4301-Me]|uniref:carbonic anhydrase n=1 Tax=Pyranulibacter aquaticus TaxID=3163344 RepID=UPI00359973EB